MTLTTEQAVLGKLDKYEDDIQLETVSIETEEKVQTVEEEDDDAIGTNVKEPSNRDSDIYETLVEEHNREHPMEESEESLEEE